MPEKKEMAEEKEKKRPTEIHTGESTPPPGPSGRTGTTGSGETGHKCAGSPPTPDSRQPPSERHGPPGSGQPNEADLRGLVSEFSERDDLASLDALRLISVGAPEPDTSRILSSRWDLTRETVESSLSGLRGQLGTRRLFSKTQDSQRDIKEVLQEGINEAAGRKFNSEFRRRLREADSTDKRLFYTLLWTMRACSGKPMLHLLDQLLPVSELHRAIFNSPPLPADEDGQRHVLSRLGVDDWTTASRKHIYPSYDASWWLSSLEEDLGPVPDPLCPDAMEIISRLAKERNYPTLTLLWRLTDDARVWAPNGRLAEDLKRLYGEEGLGKVAKGKRGALTWSDRYVCVNPLVVPGLWQAVHKEAFRESSELADLLRGALAETSSVVFEVRWRGDVQCYLGAFRDQTDPGWELPVVITPWWSLPPEPWDNLRERPRWAQKAVNQCREWGHIVWIAGAPCEEQYISRCWQKLPPNWAILSVDRTSGTVTVLYVPPSSPGLRVLLEALQRKGWRVREERISKTVEAMPDTRSELIKPPSPIPSLFKLFFEAKEDGPIAGTLFSGEPVVLVMEDPDGKALHSLVELCRSVYREVAGGYPQNPFFCMVSDDESLSALSPARKVAVLEVGNLDGLYTRLFAQKVRELAWAGHPSFWIIQASTVDDDQYTRWKEMLSDLPIRTIWCRPRDLTEEQNRMLAALAWGIHVEDLDPYAEGNSIDFRNLLPFRRLDKHFTEARNKARKAMQVLLEEDVRIYSILTWRSGSPQTWDMGTGESEEHRLLKAFTVRERVRWFQRSGYLQSLQLPDIDKLVQTEYCWEEFITDVAIFQPSREAVEVETLYGQGTDPLAKTDETLRKYQKRGEFLTLRILYPPLTALCHLPDLLRTQYSWKKARANGLSLPQIYFCTVDLNESRLVGLEEIAERITQSFNTYTPIGSMDSELKH